MLPPEVPLLPRAARRGASQSGPPQGENARPGPPRNGRAGRSARAWIASARRYSAMASRRMLQRRLTSPIDRTTFATSRLPGPNCASRAVRTCQGGCPVSTEGGTRRVHLVREGGGGGERLLEEPKRLLVPPEREVQHPEVGLPRAPARSRPGCAPRPILRAQVQAWGAPGWGGAGETLQAATSRWSSGSERRSVSSASCVLASASLDRPMRSCRHEGASNGIGQEHDGSSQF